MKTFEFYDKVTGESFFVEIEEKNISKLDSMNMALTQEKAILTARAYFQKPVFLGEVSRLEAEMLGYDTY